MGYFLITGFDGGKPIKPYIVITDSDFPQMFESKYGDFVRYYEPLTEKQVNKHLKNGIEISY